MSELNFESRAVGALLGLAVGDAVGTTVEFAPRGSFEPLTDLVGGGPFHLQAGQWTDDTSMVLCLATSLVERGRFDPVDQMNRYVKWWRAGYLSSTGDCFDIGRTTADALRRFEISGDPFSGSTDPYTAGNGSIMRLASIPIIFHQDLQRVITFAAESSRTTHGAAECLDACRLLAVQIWLALQGESREAILNQTHFRPLSPALQPLAAGEYRRKSREQIRGRGYVVDSLEAALWAFAHTASYREAILAAANLGEDADTTAAVCGQLAGAFYGREGIPAAWRARCTMREEIERLALGLVKGWGND